MALKHDAQGFLVGDPIDIGRALAVWDDIRADVRAIRRAVTEAGMMPSPQGGERATVKAFNEIAQPMARTAPVRRDADQIPALLRAPVVPKAGGTSGNAKRRDGRSPAMTDQAVASVRAANQAARKAVAKPAARDSRGRFVRGAGGNGRSPGVPGSGEDGNSEEGVLRSIADRIAGAVRESGSGMEEADPTVKAFNEIAQPMARGYELLTGGSKEKRQEGWLRRIYASLTGFRKDEGLFAKAAKKSLKNIEDKPEAEAGGGHGMLGALMGSLLGGLGRLLTRIPLVGGLLGAGGSLLKGAGRMLGFGGAAKGAGAVGKEAAVAGEAAKGAGAIGKEAGALGKAGGALKEAGSLSKVGGLFKRIPLIGTLLAGVGAASEIYGSETDDTLNRRQKDQNAGRAVGGLGGTIAGMSGGASLGAAIGTVLLPGVGTAIGAALGGIVGMFSGDKVGQVLGETFGGWVNDLRTADIPGKIASAWGSVVSVWNGVANVVSSAASIAWDSITGMAKSFWDGLTTTVSSTWEGIKNAANGANDAIKAFTGIDIKGMIGSAVDLLSRAADDLGKWVAEKTGKAWGSVKAAASNVGGFVADTWNGSTIGKAVSKGIGWVSEKYEAGKGGAGTVSTGKGDAGGASYGTYQLSSNAGTLQKFLSTSGYGSQFQGMTPGSKEFNDKWKQLAATDGKFGEAQQGFIQKTHYDPAFAELDKAGIGLRDRGQAVREAMWSTSVQFGAGSADKKNGAAGIFMKALEGRDVSKMSDAEIVAAVQDYKIANNDRLFASSNANVRKGTLDRASREKADLLALAANPPDASKTNGAQAQATPTVAAPVVAQSQMPPAAPAIPVVASAQMPRVPSAPAVPMAADSPQITVPMATADSRKQVVVASVPGDVGQDLRERGIAHIVTGGLGA